MPFSEICNGHEECPYCHAKEGTGEEGDECCAQAAEAGDFWGDGKYWHLNDDCAKEGGE